MTSVFDSDEIPPDINKPDELARAIFAEFGLNVPPERYRVRQNIWEELTLFCGTCNTAVEYGGGVNLATMLAGIRTHEEAVHGLAPQT